MIGIYKIENKINGKVYIGQSNDCARRIKEHCYPSRYLNNYPIDVAIHKHGAENFTFEVIEECSIEELNAKETYWIQFYESNTSKGYNCNLGGDQYSIGEDNNNAKVTEDDVIKIRTAYNNHASKQEVYKIVEDKVTFSSFEAIWEGRTWKHIMPEVYTPDSKEFYSKGTNCISNRSYNDEEIMEFRHLYVNSTAREIYESLNSPRLSFQGFQQMLNGRTFKHLPFYSKSYNAWVQPGEQLPKRYPNRGKHYMPVGQFSDEEVMIFRNLYVTQTAPEIYAQYELESSISLDAFSKLLRGVTYKHLPHYSKTKQQWIN